MSKYVLDERSIVQEQKLFYTLPAHTRGTKVISLTVCALLLVEDHVNLQFIANRNQLVSIGTDNSIRLFVLDTADHVPRQLKSRDGHTTTPNKIRFYGIEVVYEPS